MVSKKLKGKILAALVIGYIAAPPPPVIHAQNPVSVDSQEIDIESRESNEDFLNYLELVDTFVTAERIPSNRWDTPANVTVITAQEIEDNHYQTVAETLSHIIGIATIEDDIGTKPGRYIHMNSSPMVLVLVDGHRINDLSRSSFTSTKSNTILIPSIKIVDRIEVVKGGASALYGSDAVGGVVNIITKKGTRNETEVDVNYGSWNRQKYEITNQGVKGKLSWFMTAGFSDSDDYNRGGEDRSYVNYSDTAYRDRDLSLRLDDQFSDRNSLTVSYMHKTHDLSKRYWGNGNYVGDYYYNTLYNGASVEYRFKEDTSTPGWIRYYNHYKDTKYAFGRYKNPAKVRGLDYQNGWEFGNHKLTAGFEWLRGDVANYYGDHRMITESIYLQDAISLTDKWTVIPGVRYNYSENDEFENSWLPKIAANYRADDKTKMFASWGRVHDIGYDNLNMSIYGNEVKGHTETVGFEHDFNERSKLSVNWYGISMISYPGYCWGMEFAFNQKINENWNYNVGFSQSFGENYWDALTGQPQGYRAGIRYKDRKWKANLLGIMTRRRNQVNYNRSLLDYWQPNEYILLDLNASYDFTDRATVYVRACNLLDRDYSYVILNNYGQGSPGRFLQIGATYKF